MQKLLNLLFGNDFIISAHIPSGKTIPLAEHIVSETEQVTWARETDTYFSYLEEVNNDEKYEL